MYLLCRQAFKSHWVCLPTLLGNVTVGPTKMDCTCLTALGSLVLSRTLHVVSTHPLACNSETTRNAEDQVWNKEAFGGLNLNYRGLAGKAERGEWPGRKKEERPFIINSGDAVCGMEDGVMGRSWGKEARSGGKWAFMLTTSGVETMGFDTDWYIQNARSGAFWRAGEKIAMYSCERSGILSM